MDNKINITIGYCTVTEVYTTHWLGFDQISIDLNFVISQLFLFRMAISSLIQLQLSLNLICEKSCITAVK
uniref:Uncharacterized protein n=1 Tax=Anguilla anguilla TaxID=7936 RepID=A0A0E9Q276_ANGAN